VLLSDGLRSLAVCRASSRAEAACPSKGSVAARSWAGLQPGFISFTPNSLSPWLLPGGRIHPSTPPAAVGLNDLRIVPSGIDQVHFPCPFPRNVERDLVADENRRDLRCFLKGGRCHNCRNANYGISGSAASDAPTRRPFAIHTDILLERRSRSNVGRGKEIPTSLGCPWAVMYRSI
jgi:hypothetical protein